MKIQVNQIYAPPQDRRHQPAPAGDRRRERRRRERRRRQVDLALLGIRDRRRGTDRRRQTATPATGGGRPDFGSLLHRGLLLKVVV